MRPTTPTILFENMTKSGRETYAKSLLLRQKESRAPPPSELWQEDPTLYAKPIQPRPHGETSTATRASSAAAGPNGSLPSTVPGPRPAPLQASAVSTSFMVAETGDERQVSRGGTALSYGTAEPSMLREHRHDAGGRTFVTAALEPAPEPAPPASLPIPVLWQLHAQPDEEDPMADNDPLAAGLGALSASRAADSAAAMGRELRSINATRLQRVMGAVGETPARAALRKTREARRHAQDVLAQVREREQIAADTRILKGHTRDPGAETRPLPKAGRRAAESGGAPGAMHPSREPWGGSTAALRKKEWDGEDSVLPSGPKAPAGFPVPLQYLELVRMGSSGSVADLGATSTSTSSLGMAGMGDTAGSTGTAGFRLAKPALRYAGGGFAKAKPEREHSQEDYVELLRVAEVLDALNAVEGAVLQEHANDELMSYEQYLHTVMGAGDTAGGNAAGATGHADGIDDFQQSGRGGGGGSFDQLGAEASEQELAAEVAAAVQAGQDSLAASQADAGAGTNGGAAGAEEEETMQVPVSPRVEVRSRPNSALSGPSARSGWDTDGDADTAAASAAAAAGATEEQGQEGSPSAPTAALGSSELVGYLDGNRAPLEKPPQA